jgi:hypothetical protein
MKTLINHKATGKRKKRTRKEQKKALAYLSSWKFHRPKQKKADK